MDKKQKIHCTVESCAFNNCNKKSCELDQIMVSPCKNGTSGTPDDESMCNSYKQKN